MLSGEDVLGCASFDDSIGSTLPMEQHVAADVTSSSAIRIPRFNELPYRMLFGGLDTSCGRALRLDDHEAIGRAVPAAARDGEAAGTAAALALAATRIRATSRSKLQQQLTRQGAFIGGPDVLRGVAFEFMIGNGARACSALLSHKGRGVTAMLKHPAMLPSERSGSRG